jgi:hypothetical protein
MGDLTVTKKVRFARRGTGAVENRKGRVPRVSKLMALAIRFDQLLRDGVVADQAELARLGHVSPARLSQVMALLQLAPEIQEAIIFLPPTQRGRDPITERNLRPIAAVADWGMQRGMWGRLRVSVS